MRFSNRTRYLAGASFIALALTLSAPEDAAAQSCMPAFGNGAVVNYFNGIDATGEGMDISVTTLAGGLVEGVLSGIASRHYGSGQGSINVFGSVQGGYSGRGWAPSTRVSSPSRR